MSEPFRQNPTNPASKLWTPPDGLIAEKLLDKNLWVSEEELDEKVERSKLPPVGVIVEPMVCTITATQTPYHSAGPFVFSEADGKDMGVYYDTASRFSVTCIRSTVAGCDITADFRRITGGGLSHAYVVFQRGTVLKSNLNGLNQPIFGVSFGPYSVTVTGDFSMSGSTVDHWDGSEWRVMSWGRPGLWPFPITPTADLVARNIVGTYDTALGTATIPAPSNGGALNTAMIYQPFQLTNGQKPTSGQICGLRMEGGSTGTDTAIGLEGYEVSAYLAGYNSGATNMLSTVLEQADAFHVYPWHRRDPTTGAPIQCCGPASGLYTQAQVSGAPVGNPGLFYIQPSGGTILVVNIANSTASAISIPIGTGAGAVTVHDPASGSTYYFRGSGNTSVPANGSVNLVTVAQGAIVQSYFPWGGITLNNAPAGITGTWVSTDTGLTAEGCICTEPETNHMPNGGFLPFMLTGDPYHLETLQGKAGAARCLCPGRNWPIANTGVQFATTNGFAIEAARSIGWLLRDVAEAVIATPASVPSWLLPQSGFSYTLGQILAAVQYIYTNPPNPATSVMKFLTVAAGLQCNSNYEDYFLLASIRALVADTTGAWNTWLLEYIQNVTQGRLNPSSGWCITIPQWYIGITFNTATTWAAAFAILAANSNYSGLNNTCPTTLKFYAPPIANPDINGSDITWCYAALCRLQQMGFGAQAPGWSVAFSQLVPALRSFILSYNSAPPGWVWEWMHCFDTTLNAP